MLSVKHHLVSASSRHSRLSRSFLKGHHDFTNLIQIIHCNFTTIAQNPTSSSPPSSSSSSSLNPSALSPSSSHTSFTSLPVLPLLRCKISPEYSELNRLSQRYNFIPNDLTCRPDPRVRQRKEKTLEEVGQRWVSMQDFILYEIFGKPREKNADGRFMVVDRSLPVGLKIFKRNEFPYMTQEGFHWVMWYAGRKRERTDDEITSDVDQALKELLSEQPLLWKHLAVGKENTSDVMQQQQQYSQSQELNEQQQHEVQMQQQQDLIYDFAWYSNPKFSIPEFRHTHVFWKVY